MKWYEYLAALAVVGLFLVGASHVVLAQGAGFCKPHAEMVAGITEVRGESRLGAGSSSGYVVEVYVDPGDGSWSVLVVHPNGMACAVAMGNDGWEFGGPVPDAPSDPT